MSQRSWKPEFLVGGEWASNGQRFATREEAEATARERLMRWTAPTDYRATETSDPINYRRTEAGDEFVPTLPCDGCREKFPMDGSGGQLTDLTGDVYDLLVASPDSVDHESHKGSIFCDACILGLVKGLL
jgi:hypothetical protein